jgi:hypothetical protein
VSFGTGTAATRTHEALRYHVVGDAHLNHEIGRTWNAYATYARRVMLRESFDEPVLANTATAGLKGLFTRRLQFNFIAQAALGEVGEDRNGNKFDSYYANSSLTYSVTRFMSVGVTYSYYRHRAGEDVSLPVGYPREFDRQSVRANVNLWAPLFQRGQED